MDLDEIKRHWEQWATKYGSSLRATTKTTTIKALELDALSREIARIAESRQGPLSVLEVGCGNGVNCIYLSRRFPHLQITGVDYVAEMVKSANMIRQEEACADRLRFAVGDVTALNMPEGTFDIVFTDRCIINLNTDSLQMLAIDELSRVLVRGGHMIMIENSRQSYDRQNRARELVGLPRRQPAAFNRFLDEAVILKHLEARGFTTLRVDDFASLHDLVLYVLLPQTNGDKVEYEHPLMDAVARLNAAINEEFGPCLGSFGQNRLFVCRKDSK